MRTRIILLFLLLFFLKGFTQTDFQFYGKNNKKQQVKFKLINNLIVFPLEINGAKLQFLLDTGVNKTILFNLSKNDSVGLKNVQKIQLQGLGSGSPIQALISKKNYFKINNIRSYNQDVYVVIDDKFNLSAKMGTTIHGIIGYQLLKSVIVKINYRKKVIDFYNPKKYTPKKCRKCEVFPLEFYRNKPYINGKVVIDSINKKEIDVKLLIDSGGSDALWLFEDSKPTIKTPKKYFNDILGEGLSGTIYGKRSRLKTFSLGKFTITEPTVSFLDTLSSFNARRFKKRNGSVGGNILKRFKVWIDYKNKQLVLKKSTRLKGGFYYNMSGMSVIYDGTELIKEKQDNISFDSYGNKNSSKTTSFSFLTVYNYLFKPKFKIDKVVAGSPAALAGLEAGDKITKINGKHAHTYTLSKITNLLQRRPNYKIRLTIERLGVPMNFAFRLKQRI